jgi:hypothetical protein
LVIYRILKNKSFIIFKRQKWEKKNILFNTSTKNLVSFTPVITYTFEPALSSGPETDTITFLNIPVIVSILYGNNLKNEFTVVSRLQPQRQY